MSFNYLEWRKNENLHPVTIPNKDNLYLDLINIEHSWSGRADTNIGNTFIMEANQLLINAIELFEMGYFDCAYYSLRSAIDISTTMVFLVDMPEKDRNTYLLNWKTLLDFPQRMQMIKKLSKEGSVFIDMYNNMPIFFKKAEAISQKLNKYVHKQGLSNFYISRNHPINGDKSRKQFIENFVKHISEVIGVVAVMRLAIDPFPILLMDEEILYRCFDSLTDPYSVDFVQRYIGEDIINEYKNTNFFTSTNESFLSEEKKTKAVFDIIKHQYINTEKFDDIYKQFHLMSTEDCVATTIAHVCSKITKIYAMGGLLMYFTDRSTKRTKTTWSGLEFKQFQNSVQPYNQQFDEAFISVFKFNENYFYAEHNDILLEDEIKIIKDTLVNMEENT